MKKTLNYSHLILGAALVAATGCSHMSDSDVGSSTNTPNAMVAQSETNSPQADNSARNDRDSSGNNLTAGDQGDSLADRNLTQSIRQALVKDANFSTTAKNIKIITVNGRVTLRGPVNSESEKYGVVTLAKSVAGDGNVDDQLEIKSNQ